MREFGVGLTQARNVWFDNIENKFAWRLVPSLSRLESITNRICMILLLPAILIAVVVILWIIWSPVGPKFGRPSAMPNPLASLDESRPEDQPNDRPKKTNIVKDSETEYKQHLETRLETSHAPIGSMTGIQGLSSSVAPLRERSAVHSGEERES